MPAGLPNPRRDLLYQPQFGRRLKRVRAARGVSQADVVGEAMSTEHLSCLESGETAPRGATVADLARRLGPHELSMDIFRTSGVQGMVGVGSGGLAGAPSPVAGEWDRRQLRPTLG
ncbi:MULTISPECIES: helix-turn-helix domain-containing protein [unclassified Streptomyces]|uniref:helix-turn-helix domain-containing protein n=1 Tax=unclassified Streptomyces TaxID=2593676 RepID=UPI0027DEE2AE|nr:MULTISPECIES: helix-turn-helix domain-containing protein [unclassified Streptomyces]MDU0300067.1 helix-turn-helix domain-containing protein [Streptomyces sp. PAL114]